MTLYEQELNRRIRKYFNGDWESELWILLELGFEETNKTNKNSITYDKQINELQDRRRND